jgi:hypothetical protein
MTPEKGFSTSQTFSEGFFYSVEMLIFQKKRHRLSCFMMLRFSPIGQSFSTQRDTHLTMEGFFKYSYLLYRCWSFLILRSDISRRKIIDRLEYRSIWHFTFTCFTGLTGPKCSNLMNLKRQHLLPKSDIHRKESIHMDSHCKWASSIGNDKWNWPHLCHSLQCSLDDALL